MNRAGRFLGRTVLVLAAVILLAGLVLAVAGDRIYPRLLEAAARSGGKLTVYARGPVTLQVWPAVRVTAVDLGVAQAGPTPAWDAQLPDMRLELAGHSLLRGRLVLEKVEIHGARVRINRAAGTVPGAAEPASTLAANLAQAHILIEDAQIEFAGIAPRKRHTVQLDHYASGPGPDGHPQVEARGTVDGSTVSMDGGFSPRAERIGNIVAFPLTASVSVPDWKLKGTVQGHVAQPLEGKGLSLETTLEIGDVTPLARVLDLPEVLSGGAQLHAVLVGELPLPRLVQVKAALNSGGTLSARIEGAGIDLASGDIESLRFRLDGPLPASIAGKTNAVHHVSTEGSLNGGPGRYTVAVERALVEMPEKMRVEANGSLEFAALDDWAFTDSQLQFKASAPSVAALAHFLGNGSLPEIGPGELHGKLTGALTAATLGALDLRIGAQGPVRISARGKIGPLHLGDVENAIGKAETDVRMEVTVDDSQVLQAVLGRELATLRPWTGQGRVRTSRQHWHLSDLDVTAGNKNDVLFEVSGEAKGRGDLGAGVKRVVTVSPAKDDTVGLDVTLESADAQATGRALGVKVPELGALKGRARFQTEGEPGGPRVLVLRGLELQSTGELAMQLTGDIGSLSGFEDVNLELTLADTPPEVIDRLLDLELPLSGEVSLNGRLRRPGQQVLRVDGEARVGSSRLALQLTAERTDTVPLIKGQIHSTAIHSHDFSLADVPLAPVKQRRRKAAATGGLGLLGILPGIDFVLQDAVEQQEQAQQEDSKPVAPDPLPWTRLRHVDIDLNVHIDTVHGVHISGGPLDLRLVDRAGRLQFGPSTLTFKGGSVSIRGVADSNDTPPSLTVNGRGVRLRIDEIAANRGMKSAELAGQLTFDYELHSRGETLPELRAALGGKIQALVEHGQFPLRNLDLLSGSLLEWLTTWVTSDKAAPVPCAVADFTINNGVAEVKTLYVKTDTSAAYGIGNIDLRADRLDLTITPKVRGFSLSPPATIHIHGPLASPQVEVGNIAAVALRYGTEVIQGISFPPSLLLGHLFGKMATSEPGPCRRAGAR